jgi:hypothetical protein
MNDLIYKSENNKINIINKKQDILNTIAHKLQNDINNSIFLKLKNTDGKLLFKYGIIFIIIFKLLLLSNITFSIFVAIIGSLIYVYFIYDKDSIYSTTKNKQLDFKLNSIFPSPKHIKSHPKLIEFVHSIKDFRLYNEDSFDKMLKCIDNVIQIYNELLIGLHNMPHHIDIMIDNKKKAINYLHSIIYNMEEKPVIINKLNKSIKVLNILLQSYIDKAIDISNKELEKNGYDITSRKMHKNELDGIYINNINSNSYDLNNFMVFN